jgi:hypothetical protein
MLRRIFGPKRDEVTGEWRRIHNKELYALYSSPNIIWVIKKTEVGRACSTWGRVEVHTGFQWGNLREGDHIEDLGIDGRVILKWILEKWDGGTWTRSILLRVGTGGRLLCMR